MINPDYFDTVDNEPVQILCIDCERHIEGCCIGWTERCHDCHRTWLYRDYIAAVEEEDLPDDD